MWLELLRRVDRIESGYGEKLNSPIDLEKIKFLSQNETNEVKTFMVQEYSRFITKVNGLDFNGCVLYGLKADDSCSSDIYDFFEYNKIWHEVEENKQFVFIGENNISWFVYNPSNDEYLELDMPSADVVEKFNSLDDLLESFLSDALEYAS
ncbi:YrhA family protein [Streptococcus oralis]|uniref:SMI1/KNR4 family protein n=1 Tax=Streptococcus oralis SK610 TaxID=1095741 RepID=I0Q0P3_STROR|nr:YrhA family protein [Streptococcus oralis]EIC74845.1 hypothetical protein HMPREF1115_1592 [Streptococcus oralis SK610]MBU6873288.1 YrhA family protein [Streptococcus oralis]RSK17902.1 hypothetical protein D8846_08920 [Streptococcus oralis]